MIVILDMGILDYFIGMSAGAMVAAAHGWLAIREYTTGRVGTVIGGEGCCDSARR